MNNTINWLNNWILYNCDSDWEHTYGIKIQTLDNPGWSVKIDIEETPMMNVEFENIEIENDDDDWIHCKVEDNIFYGYGDLQKLENILLIFRNWVENHIKI